MSLADFNRTILNYLVWSGQEEAAIAFWNEIEKSQPFDLSRASSIIALKQAIKRQEFAEAWEVALDIDGTRLVSHPEVEIAFALAMIVKSLILNEPALAIIEQAKQTVVPSIARLQQAELKFQFDTMSEHLVSLSISPQSNPPVKQLMEPEKLEKWVLHNIQDFLYGTDDETSDKFATIFALQEYIKS